MTTIPMLTDCTISRRTTMGMALAAMFAGKIAVLPGLVAADDAHESTWNWDGNAGHTEELPGPGLDFDKPLGEIWRMPGDEFGEFAGYLNGIFYTVNSNESGEYTSIAASNLLDGKLLWTVNASSVSPDPAAEFDSSVAIDNDILLVTLSNGHLWALDALTGVLHWDFDSESEYIGAPTVVDHVAYFAVPDGICALKLGEHPEILWKTQFDGYQQWWWLGINGELVCIHGIMEQQIEIRALAIEDGSEFWRMTGNELGDPSYILGMIGGNLLCMFGDPTTTGPEHLGIVGDGGSLKWSKDFIQGISGWFLQGVVATATEDFDTSTYTVHGLVADNGLPLWAIDLNTRRWYLEDWPVICASIAYIAVYDHDEDRSLMVVADPGNATLVGALETGAIPIFVGDGIMLAKDKETDDIVAIGAAPAVVRAGDRAKVTKDVALRGAPSESAVNREELNQGTLVDVTGESETSNNIEWLPVTVSETGSSGWLAAAILERSDEGVVSGMNFFPIDMNEFGQFTTY